MANRVWREANTRLIPCVALAVIGAVLSAENGNVRYRDYSHKLIALFGVFLFVAFATTALHILTAAIHKLAVTHRLGSGRPAALQFGLRVFGYVVIVMATLELIGISIERLLLGSAVLGIILGVAAQQALANFFASVVLIISHPFEVGDRVLLNSGALGGKYTGTIVDIGLTHTRMQLDDESVIFLPNATLLSGAAITPKKQKPALKSDKVDEHVDHRS